MFWNKKEEQKGLPDLPPPKTSILPPPINTDGNHEEESNDEETLSRERHGLPSFPDSPIQKGFSQAAIKDAISSPDNEEEIANAPESEKTFRAVEIEEWSPTMPMQSITAGKPIPQISSQVPATSSPIIKKESRPTITQNDIFVKIDKFYSAKRSLEGIQQKIEEIDEVLKKIRETKLREEQELSSWEKEVTMLKSRVREVTETIFEKVT